MNTIKDFLALPNDEKPFALEKTGKYLAERYKDGRIVKLYEVCDTLLEMYFDEKKSNIIRATLLDSSETLDLYIDTMIKKGEKKKKESTTWKIFLNRSLIYLIQHQLKWYEHIYFPYNNGGTMRSGDIPFMHFMTEDFNVREGDEEQYDINVYVAVHDKKEENNYSETLFPASPENYERPGDKFLVIGICPGEDLFIGCKIFQFMGTSDKPEKKLLWSDAALEY